MSKDETKSKDETVSVNVDEFTKTRDSVLLSLAQLQSAVSDLSRAYINHTNTVLKRDQPGFDISRLTSITNTLYESGLLGDGPAPGAGGDKRKRKRAPHDPNAPKRALTPFFLYMQHERPNIAKELGPSARPKDVSDEGTARWQRLSEGQKEVWRKLYADNLESYRQKMKAYKAGLPVPDDNAQAENQLQQSAAEADASDRESEQSSSEEEAESEAESSPSPAKEPTPPRSNKRRRSEGKTTATPSKKEEPEKKKRGTAKKDKEEETASARKTGAEPKRTTKKKRKSEAGEE
ncbi:HMG box protein [Aspergillus sclerotialis]|uniref:HMG box protein n=1 Tax=Aspergillus sclerotialis TaxID=2070753 RepID=A0A3A2Z9V8_9EURO|nr:HMG box protein [Aspergillus sclerotialis]